MFLFTSPHAPRVDPIFLITVENTVFMFCLSTPWSWKVCLVVRRRVPFPYRLAKSSMVLYSRLSTLPPGCFVLIMNWYALPCPNVRFSRSSCSQNWAWVNASDVWTILDPLFTEGKENTVHSACHQTCAYMSEHAKPQQIPKLQNKVLTWKDVSEQNVGFWWIKRRHQAEQLSATDIFLN
jgi:hypothetical protein